MSAISELHDRALALADDAFLARRRGDRALAAARFGEAMVLEAAADLLRNSLAAEPSRPVLYRSAVSLAMNSRQFGEAERLIAAAFEGHPPAEIAAELRDLLARVEAERQPTAH